MRVSAVHARPCEIALTLERRLDKILQCGPFSLRKIAQEVITCGGWAQVPRLQGAVRDRRANWGQSIAMLRAAKAAGAQVTKTSIMLGCGEHRDEVVDAMRLLREAGGCAGPLWTMPPHACALARWVCVVMSGHAHGACRTAHVHVWALPSLLQPGLLSGHAGVMPLSHRVIGLTADFGMQSSMLTYLYQGQLGRLSPGVAAAFFCKIAGGCKTIAWLQMRGRQGCQWQPLLHAACCCNAYPVCMQLHGAMRLCLEHC